jgi:hypothetical protein
VSERPPPSPLNPTFALALVATLGCLLLAFANLNQERVVEWIVSDPERTAFRLRALLALLGLVGVLPVALMAAFAARLSIAISTSGRYPPPGVALRQRTEVRRGAEADSIARRLRIAAIVLGAIALAIPPLFWWLAATLTPS